MKEEYTRMICEYTKEETEVALKLLKIIKSMDKSSNGEIKIKGHRDELKNLLKKSIRLDDGDEKGNWMQMTLIISMNYNEDKEDSTVTINFDIIDYIYLLERELKKKIDI